MSSEHHESYESPDSPELRLAAQELMSEDPAAEVRVFDNGKKVLTLRLDDPEIHGATKVRNIYLGKNVAGPRELLEQMSSLHKTIRWLTHPDPNLPRERQDELKLTFLARFQQTRALMHELGI